jgi:hypothetical protein
MKVQGLDDWCARLYAQIVKCEIDDDLAAVIEGLDEDLGRKIEKAGTLREVDVAIRDFKKDFHGAITKIGKHARASN